MSKKNFSFEESVIDPILETIRDNQEFLTKKPNLPQLAKLGYMYDTLWYAGRVCWGYDGILRDKTGLSKDDDSYYEDCSCEDNPKYKIEMCNPKNEKIDNLIYDAWGLHVRNEGNETSFADFKKLILEGENKTLTELDKLLIKPKKTMDEWVKALTDPKYRYHSIYQTKRSVYDHLLCVIGNGYALGKDGFVIQKASGADQDISVYGDWRNAKFADNIQQVVDRILAMPEVEKAIDKTREYFLKLKEKTEKKKSGVELLLDKIDELGVEETLKLFDKDGIDDNAKETAKKIIDSYLNLMGGAKEKEKYHPYYPICNYSIIYQIIDNSSLKRIGVKTVDPSLIEAGKEICREILEHEAEENKARKGNVDFARRFLAKFGEADASFIPKEINKKGALKQVNKAFSNFVSGFPQCKTQITLNDSAKSQYADDNINISIDIKDVADAPTGLFNNIESLKDISIYEKLKLSLENLSKIKDVLRFTFDYINWTEHSKRISIFVVLNPKYDNEYNNSDKAKSDANFVADGFMIGGNCMAKKLDKMGLIIVTEKSEPLGTTHPNNKSGKEYFSKAKYFTVCDSDWKPILNFHIDERGFNLIYSTDKPTSNLKIQKWILEEHAKMKSSDPAYGTFENPDKRTGEGKKCLYAFDFINWLYNNQI